MPDHKPNHKIMKAFDFLSAITELGISNDVYVLFSKDAQIDAATFSGSASSRVLFGTIPNGSDMAAVWGDSEIKGTPAACVHTENQFIFIYEME